MNETGSKVNLGLVKAILLQFSFAEVKVSIDRLLYAVLLAIQLSSKISEAAVACMI